MTIEASPTIEIELTDEQAASVEEAARIAGITPEELFQIALERLVETARANRV